MAENEYSGLPNAFWDLPRESGGRPVHTLFHKSVSFCLIAIGVSAALYAILQLTTLYFETQMRQRLFEPQSTQSSMTPNASVQSNTQATPIQTGYFGSTTSGMPTPPQTQNSLYAATNPQPQPGPAIQYNYESNSSDDGSHRVEGYIYPPPKPADDGGFTFGGP